MEITVWVGFGALGLLAIAYAIWVKDERVQNIWFIVGGVGLLLYSISITNYIFIALQAVFILSATFELFKKRASRG